MLVAVAEQTGLSYTWSKISEDTFSRDAAYIVMTRCVHIIFLWWINRTEWKYLWKIQTNTLSVIDESKQFHLRDFNRWFKTSLVWDYRLNFSCFILKTKIFNFHVNILCTCLCTSCGFEQRRALHIGKAITKKSSRICFIVYTESAFITILCSVIFIFIPFYTWTNSIMLVWFA